MTTACSTPGKVVDNHSINEVGKPQLRSVDLEFTHRI